MNLKFGKCDFVKEKPNERRKRKNMNYNNDGYSVVLYFFFRRLHILRIRRKAGILHEGKLNEKKLMKEQKKR